MLSAEPGVASYTRSSTLRLTLLFTLLGIIVNTMVLGAVYWLTSSEREQQIQSNVLMAADTFRQLAGPGAAGQASLRRVVEAHARNAANTLLALDSEGEVSGNLSELPRQVPAYPNTGRFAVAVAGLSGESSVEIARGTRITLPNGELMVAQLEPDIAVYRRNFLLASALALGLGAILGIVVGYLFNRRQVQRLRRLSSGIESIQRGRLDHRLPCDPRGDELDVLAGQVNRMLDEIDELISSIAGVTDNIAHDLRTPLSRLRLRLDDITDTLQALPTTEPALLDTLTHAQGDLDQLLDTFEAMLELARLEKGSRLPEGSQVQLADIAGDVVELLAPVAEEHNQTLALSCEGAGQVRADTNLLFRALYNLVDNAICHAGSGAHILVRQTGTQIQVQDSGPGIPAAEREKVFQRLYRLDQSRSQGGTGLGLPIVRAIAQLHSARINLDDAEPGLVVTLDFSLQEPV